MGSNRTGCSSSSVAAPRTRRFIAVLLIFLLPLPLGAQTPSPKRSVSVRFTGPDSYEVPGVMRLEGDRVFGNAATADSRFVQFRRSDSSRLETIPRPGKRVTGKALAIADGLLEFVPEGNAEHLYVPLDAVVKIEASRVSGSQTKSITAGLYTGVGIFLTTWFALAAFCDEGQCGNEGALSALWIGGAIAGGAMVGRMVRGQKWRVVSLDELDGALSGTP